MDKAREKMGKKRSLFKAKTKGKVFVLRTKKALVSLKNKSKIKDSDTDIIFDSTIGKTDSLFVNKPSQIS